MTFILFMLAPATGYYLTGLVIKVVTHDHKKMARVHRQ